MPRRNARDPASAITSAGWPSAAATTRRRSAPTCPSIATCRTRWWCRLGAHARDLEPRRRGHAGQAGKPQVDFDERIYESTPKALLAVLRETGPKVRTLMMVGHNPSMQELAVQLVATGDIETRQRLQEAFPTSGLAVIEFALDSWDRVHPQSGRLEHFITPRWLAEPTA